MQFHSAVRECSGIGAIIEKLKKIYNYFKSEMNQIRRNLERDKNNKEQYCIQDCMQVLDNDHITWCKCLNEANKQRYSDILNGDSNEKFQSLKQIRLNNRKREEGCDPVLCWSARVFYKGIDIYIQTVMDVKIAFYVIVLF